MSTTKTATATKPQAAPQPAEPAPMHPIVEFKRQLDTRADQLHAALPAHIPVERFVRVVLTAVQRDPELLAVDRQSLWNACLQAAQDGLLPDGREGAIVRYRDKDRGPIAQWLPMYQGLLKKFRNSGEFKWVTAQVVRVGDVFRHWVDEAGEHLIHEPCGANGDVIRVYAVATTKSGGAFVEVMTVGEIEKVRGASRAKSERSPWSQWWEPMACKTVMRRLAKRLPMSSDLDDLVRRDDDLYDFEGQREERKQQQLARPAGVTAALEHFERAATGAKVVEHAAVDLPATPEPAPEPQAPEQEAPAPDAMPRKPASAPVQEDKLPAAEIEAPEQEAPRAAAEWEYAGMATDGVWDLEYEPTDPAEYLRYAEAKVATFADANLLTAWFRSQAERNLRNACAVMQPDFDRVQAIVRERATALRQQEA